MSRRSSSKASRSLAKSPAHLETVEGWSRVAKRGGGRWVMVVGVVGGGGCGPAGRGRWRSRSLSTSPGALWVALGVDGRVGVERADVDAADLGRLEDLLFR